MVLLGALLSAPQWKKHPQAIKPAQTNTQPLRGPSESKCHCCIRERSDTDAVGIYVAAGRRGTAAEPPRCSR